MEQSSKTKFHLVGDTFTHLTGGNKGYSVHGKESEYIEWSKLDGEATFYLDDYIKLGIMDSLNTRKKYGWLTESKFITPEIVETIPFNMSHIEKTYEAIFTHNQELLKLGGIFKWVPANGIWIKELSVRPKTKLISMISSSKRMVPGHETRLQWVDKLRNKVDLYGRGFNEIEFKEQGLEDYMFSVAIENGQYETYFTEKILDCFATGTIPVYLGAPDIGKYFNPDGIIKLTDDFEVSEDLYYKKIDAVRENLELAKNYEVVEDFIFKNYLEK